MRLSQIFFSGCKVTLDKKKLCLFFQHLLFSANVDDTLQNLGFDMLKVRISKGNCGVFNSTTISFRDCLTFGVFCPQEGQLNLFLQFWQKHLICHHSKVLSPVSWLLILQKKTWETTCTNLVKTSQCVARGAFFLVQWQSCFSVSKNDQHSLWWMVETQTER